jgi:hypothetical protein
MIDTMIDKDLANALLAEEIGTNIFPVIPGAYVNPLIKRIPRCSASGLIR